MALALGQTHQLEVAKFYFSSCRNAELISKTSNSRKTIFRKIANS